MMANFASVKSALLVRLLLPRSVSLTICSVRQKPCMLFLLLLLPIGTHLRLLLHNCLFGRSVLAHNLLLRVFLLSVALVAFCVLSAKSLCCMLCADCSWLLVTPQHLSTCRLGWRLGLGIYVSTNFSFSSLLAFFMTMANWQWLQSA